MSQTLRHPEILEIARREGKVTVEGLARHFNVTLQTIRRDLNELSAAGRLEREDMGWLKRIVVGDESQQRLERARRFAATATALGHPPATLAIAWCLRNPHVSTVILGASRVEQLLQNLEALQLVEGVEESAWQQVEAAIG